MAVVTTSMRKPKPASRPSRTSRFVGYTVLIIVDSILLSVINGWPGWQSAPFLTADFALVVVFVNISLIGGLAANLVYVLVDPPRLKAAGDTITTLLGLVALLAVWTVFPFAFASDQTLWTLVVRTILAVSIGGCAIAIVVSVVSFLRNDFTPRR